MSRNYQREEAIRSKKKDEIRARIDIQLGTALRNKLRNEGKTVVDWVTENAKKYLEKK